MFVEKELISNPNGLKNTPAPLSKGKIVDVESFEYAWKTIINEYLKPMENL